MDGKCANCEKDFEQKKSGHGYKRHSLFSLNEGDVQESINTLPFTPQSKRKGHFLCPECFNLLNGAISSSKKTHAFSSKTTPNSYIGGKRKLNTPTKTPRKLKSIKYDTPGKSRIPSKRTDLKLLKNYEYVKGFTHMVRNSTRAKAALIKVFLKEIKKELKGVKKEKENLMLGARATDKIIKSFDWKTALLQVKNLMPSLFQTIESALGTSRLTRDINPVLGTIISIILHKNFPKSFNLFQSMNSVHLWREGVSQSLFKDLNHLSLCLSHKASISRVDTLRHEYDENLKTWKHETEEFLSRDPDDLDSGDEDMRDIMLEELEIEDGVAPLQYRPKEIPPGFTICWDNVGKHLTARHHSKDHGNTMNLWAMAYMAKNRVPTLHLDDNQTKDAIAIPVVNFLPSDEDFTLLEERMIRIVERVLSKYMPAFQELFPQTNKPIQHQKWEESTKKSELITIGIINENPSTTAGVVRILENLHAYVPTKPALMPLISWGDALSCERHNDAHNIRCNGASPSVRLEGLEPGIQEFHKRILLMQDTMNSLYNPATATQKGSLYYIRNLFNHRGVKKDVTSSFNHTSEFLEFVFQGYVLLMALELLDLKSLDETLSEKTKKEKVKLLKRVATQIVHCVWVQPDLNKVTDSKTKRGYCKCNDVSDVPNNEEPMVGCDNLDCQAGEWFHLSCVSLEQLPSRDEEWFCSSKCRTHWKKRKEPKDRKLEYVKSVIWTGLNDLVRHDAVRENDGPAMISFWKHDLVSFHQNHHPKYFILAHRLLAAINGWLPERLREDLTWNRTVNYRGGPGHNLEMDIVCEFHNREFKDRIGLSGNALTDDVLARHSQLSGGIGQSLDSLYHYQVSSQSTAYSKNSKQRDNSADLRVFVETLFTQKLCKESAKPRCFKHYENFQHSATLRSPNTLFTKIVTQSIKLDKRRKIVANM